MIRHTHFTGGGLQVDSVADLSGHMLLQGSKDASLPEYIDSRPFCLPTSPQGNHPYCSGISAVGYIEVKNWRKYHVARQIDFEPVYKRAKERDGNNNRGTSLKSVSYALKDLDIYEWNSLQIIDDLNELKYAFLTQDVAMLGFRITDAWNHVGDNGWIEEDGDEPDLGGHAVLGCGYKSGSHVMIKNSWAGWGDNGFGKISENMFNQQFIYGIVLE